MATSSITTNFVVKSSKAKKSLEKALSTSNPSAIVVCDTDKLKENGEKKLNTILSHYKA